MELGTESIITDRETKVGDPTSVKFPSNCIYALDPTPVNEKEINDNR